MMKTHLYARPAGSALVAGLALLATPVLAQDASAPVVIAETPPATSAPTIVIPEPIVVPDSAPATTTAATPVAVAPVASETAERAAQPAPASRRAATRSERAVEAAPVAAAPKPAAMMDSAPLVEEAAIAPLAPVAAEAAPADEPAPIASEPQPATDNSLLMLAGGGLVAALAVIGLFMASARRRRRAVSGEPLARPAFKPEAEGRAAAAKAPAAPVANAAAPSGFVVSHAVSRDRGMSKWEDPVYVNAAPAAVAGRAVPNTPEGRKALIDRLVRARPDRTNPFRSLAARRRRARLIVQSLAQSMREQPNLDFRRFYDSFGRREPTMA